MLVQSVDTRRWLARLRELSEEMTPDYADYAPTPVEDFLDPDDPTLFPRLTPEQVDYLAEIGTQLSFARGELVFEHGQRETPMYVVLSGDRPSRSVAPASIQGLIPISAPSPMPISRRRGTVGPCRRGQVILGSSPMRLAVSFPRSH
jgi:hypothetical protein